MFTKTNFWRPGTTESIDRDKVVTLANLTNSWGANYILDVRRKRTPDASESYINQGGCYLKDNKYLLCLCNIDYTYTELLIVDLLNYNVLRRYPKIANLHHSNDCAFYNNRVYICTYDGQGGSAGLAIFDFNNDDNTLTYVKTVSLDRPIATIAVDKTNGYFYGKTGNSIYNINIFNGVTTILCEYNINTPVGAFHNNIVNDYSITGQGITFRDGLFYIANSFPNCIYVVNMLGDVLNIINIPQVSQGHVVGEMESLDFDENGRLYINAYGRGLNDNYSLEEAELTWGITRIFEIGAFMIDNETFIFRNVENTNASNTVGSRRKIYVNAVENYYTPATLRHTGAVNYPFDTIQDAMFFGAYITKNSPRTKVQFVISGRIGEYSKWASMYLTADIELNNAYIDELHVGEGDSVKITGNGTINKIYLLYGSTLDLRVNCNYVASSSGNLIYMLGDNTIGEVAVNGSVVRIDSRINILGGTLTGCMIFAPTHENASSMTELANVVIADNPMFYGRSTQQSPTA